MESWLDDLLDATYAPKYQDQGSDAWDNIRAGRFTSSEWHNLMECGKRPMTKEELEARPKKGPGSATTLVPDPSKMSKGGITYITQKVAEVLTGRPRPSAYAYPLVYGKETEPQAVEHFEKVMEVECIEVGFQPFGDHAGGSPDRLFGDDDGLEVKCPYDSANQIGYLMLTDRFDLKRMHPDYYWQCVSLMLFTNRKTWHFCTFDPRMIQEKHKMTHIVLKWSEVEEDIDLCIKALAGAVEEKLKLIALLS